MTTLNIVQLFYTALKLRSMLWEKEKGWVKEGYLKGVLRALT
jgi:hypothetical protein